MMTTRELVRGHGAPDARHATPHKQPASAAPGENEAGSAAGPAPESSAGPVAAAARRRGEVLTVFSPKGGVGTTAVAGNLAILLASPTTRVCLVDLSLEFGDVAIVTRLVPSRTIVDAGGIATCSAAGADDLAASVCIPYREGVDCVLAPVSPSAAERVSPADVAGLLHALRRRYDFVVVDTPSQLSEAVLEAFDAATHRVLVTTPDIPSLKSVRLVLDTYELLGYPRERSAVLVNRADPRRGYRRADVVALLGTEPAAELPVSPAFGDAVNTGTPRAIDAPGDPVVTALRNFAARSIPDSPVAATHRPRRFELRRRSR